MLLALLLSPALASPGLDALSAGDRARYDDDRAAAVTRYQEAIDSGEPAAEAMARLRMLSLSGNLGALWHGPALDAALAAAELDPTAVAGGWCALAEVDYHLMAPAFAGADAATAIEGARALLETLPGPASARLYYATGDEAWLAALEAVPAEARDGMGDGILAAGRARPPSPGTWFLGIGLAGAPGQGLGGGLIWKHPDLARRRWWLYASLGATSRGSLNGALHVASPGRLYADASLAGYRLVADLYDDEDQRDTYTLSGARARLGPGLRFRLGEGRARTWAAGEIRIDDLGEGPQTALGPAAGASWSTLRGSRGGRRGQLASLSGEWAAWGDYPSLQLTADARAFTGALGGALGARLLWRGELFEETPFYRLPTAGGSVYHRGAWAGRWIAPWIATVDLEQRWSAGDVLEPVVFINAAQVAGAGLHYGAGAGVRLVLPPENLNIVRLDIGVSDLGYDDPGWGLYVGWGEAF